MWLLFQLYNQKLAENFAIYAPCQWELNGTKKKPIRCNFDISLDQSETVRSISLQI